MTEPDFRIGAVKKTFDIIKLIDGTNGATASAVADRLDLPISTAYDYLQTLKAVGAIVQYDSVYHLSLRFLKFGESQKRRMPEYIEGKPLMSDLADETGEHVSLLVEQGSMGAMLHIEEGEGSVSFRTYPGVMLYLHTTAAGKAILSTFDDEKVLDVIDEHGLPAKTSNTITKPETLFEELAEIRETGVATDSSEIIEELFCVAAPIRNNQDGRISALSVCIPMTRINEQEGYEKEIKQLVKETSNLIQVNINYS